jgi:5-hydroxyisourate hydrolase-like protein (transthyretin family)
LPGKSWCCQGAACAVDVAVWLSAPACAHCWATGEVSAEGKCAQPVNTKAKTKTRNKMRMINTMKEMKDKQLHLLTTKFRVEGFYSFVFPVFEFFRDTFMKKTPCAIGGFMLFKTSEFKRLGGFNNEDKFAEDYHLSMKVSPNRFYVTDDTVLTTDRRFRKKGLWYMIKMGYLSKKNKYNNEFFKDDQNYWV